MWWKAFLAAFGLLFVAELGDKTQLIILTLSARSGFRQVFLGAAAAFAFLNALAVSLGILVYEFVPEEVIKYAVTAAFVIIGIFLLLPERKREGYGEEAGDEEEGKKGRGPLLSAFLLVSLMELGDKTQLTLLALTAEYSQPIFVFVGGTLALWATSLIGALIGARLGGLIHPVWMRRISGVIFIAFGIANLFW
jgi:Ca2+/H+ antiporter, TMEM165/GDT1 family